MLIEFGVHHERYNLRPIFRDVTDSMRVNDDEKVYRIKSRLSHHRKAVFLVDTFECPASLVYQNKDGCVSCATHKYRCPHAVRLMSALGIDSVTYKRDRASKNMKRTENSTFQQLKGLSREEVPVPLPHRTVV